jgi:hypothetical protein
MNSWYTKFSLFFFTRRRLQFSISSFDLVAAAAMYAHWLRYLHETNRANNNQRLIWTIAQSSTAGSRTIRKQTSSCEDEQGKSTCPTTGCYVNQCIRLKYIRDRRHHRNGFDFYQFSSWVIQKINMLYTRAHFGLFDFKRRKQLGPIFFFSVKW